MIHPHRLPIDTPVPRSVNLPPTPAWFYECFLPLGWPLSVEEMDRVWACYQLLNPDLPQNKKPDFEIGAV